MILKPSSMSRVSVKSPRTDTMVLPADHAAQPSEIALSSIDVNVVEKAIRIRVVDPLDGGPLQWGRITVRSGPSQRRTLVLRLVPGTLFRHTERKLN
jgi:hypothetical protein